MANLVRVPCVPRVPFCLQCLRVIALPDVPRLAAPFQQQVRGKKKVAKAPSTIKVKLLEDIKGYGRSGSIIPVAPGRMRNVWYPTHKAAYMTKSELKDLGDVVAERDVRFGMEEEQNEQEEHQKKEDVEQMVDVQMKLLPPARATEIMAAVIPPEMMFYRTPIAVQEQDGSPESPNLIQTPDIKTLLRLVKPGPKPIKIYGSVSTVDISDNVKSILAQHEEGVRIVLGPEDVSIAEEGEYDNGVEPGRIKALGSFAVDIRVKGGEAIRRTVIVKAQEDGETESRG